LTRETQTLEPQNLTMNDIIIKKIEARKRGYLNEPELILQGFRDETNEIEGYHGRELLELLQNAVDELGAATNRHVCIELSGNILRFSNNGSVFSQDGITSLMYSHLSPKHNDQTYIGNKGTGFRSVLNWANGVRIYSGDLSIEFNPVFAEELLNELLKDENIKNYQIRHPDLKVATLVAPQIIPQLFQKAYDTVIELDVKEAMLDDVQAQINKIDARTLLFLDELERLTIIQNEEKIVFDKTTTVKTEEQRLVSITTYVNDDITDFDEWCRFSPKMTACISLPMAEEMY